MTSTSNRSERASELKAFYDRYVPPIQALRKGEELSIPKHEMPFQPHAIDSYLGRRLKGLYEVRGASSKYENSVTYVRK